ncbi:MAG: DUF692 family multinuclear iron-containing protein [Phycisphaerae bacterium]
MDAASLVGLPALGVGLGYREPLRAEIFRHRDEIDFLEITADHFFDPTPERRALLDLLHEHFTLIPHGLDLSLGSAEGLDESYADKFAALIQRLEPPWWSEHIAFTRAGGVRIGHLAPLPFTREAAEVVCRNVAAMQARVGRAAPATPLILENITYTVAMPDAEMSEGAFVRTVLEGCGAGLLLDVTNVYANAVNHGRDPLALLDEFPLERVVQLHFVGGYWRDGVFIDGHSAPTPPEVWELLDAVCARAPVRGVILERDEHIPAMRELVPELRRAREILRRHGRTV